MATPITIAIIGATGTMGSAITRSLNRSPYRLLLIAGNKEKLQRLLEEAGKDSKADIEAIHCTVDACWEADMIIAAVPYLAEKKVAEKIRQVATGKIVISISNPADEVSFNGSNISAAEELQELLPHSKVVKAFNTVYATDFSKSLNERNTIDALIAGDDEQSVHDVCTLVQYAGFNAVKAGSLNASRHLENMEAITIL
jgi:predicted dinucleotide-binding enzyme